MTEENLKKKKDLYQWEKDKTRRKLGYFEKMKKEIKGIG